MVSPDFRFKVKLKGRAGGLYIEGKKKMKINSEMLVGPTDIVIYTDSINSWEPPFDKERFSDEDKSRIIENIKNDLEKAGLKVVLA